MIANETATRSRLAYALVTVIGIGAFVYPFWLPAESLPGREHAADAPLVASAVGLLALAAVALDLRRGAMTGATVAVLGVLSAVAGLLRLLDLPGGGSGLFFLVILAGAAFGPRFGFLLGLLAMAVGAIVTGGIGPWLPFQMLALAWIGAATGAVGRLTRRLPPAAEVAVLVVVAWACGFLYGGIMNLWSWPLVTGDGPLDWRPGLDWQQTLARYWRFYVATSLAWDAAGATANAAATVVLARPVLRTLRRFSPRLEPHVELLDPGCTLDELVGAGGVSAPTRSSGTTSTT